MTGYAQSAMCRWKLLLDYFGEPEAVERCGACDNCVHPLDDQHTPPEKDPFGPLSSLKPAV